MSLNILCFSPVPARKHGTTFVVLFHHKQRWFRIDNSNLFWPSTCSLVSRLCSSPVFLLCFPTSVGIFNYGLLLRYWTLVICDNFVCVEFSTPVPCHLRGFVQHSSSSTFSWVRACSKSQPPCTPSYSMINLFIALFLCFVDFSLTTIY